MSNDRPFGSTLWGKSIEHAIDGTIALAKREACGIFIDFNGVEVRVTEESDARLIYRDWDRAMRGYIDKSVGPHPSLSLTPEEIASDKRIKSANKVARAKRDREYARAAQEKAERVAALLAAAPAMTITNVEMWQKGLSNNQDGYGRGVYTFAERWARLMEQAINSGKQLADVADDLVSDADAEGITGFMYGCAVSILSACWIHGEELRRWHNIKTQIHDEGELANESGAVLNPALLSLG